MKIAELIKQHEGRRLEFKAKMPVVADIAKTIVAFANDAAWNQVGTRLAPGWKNSRLLYRTQVDQGDNVRNGLERPD